MLAQQWQMCQGLSGSVCAGSLSQQRAFIAIAHEKCGFELMQHRSLLALCKPPILLFIEITCVLSSRRCLICRRELLMEAVEQSAAVQFAAICLLALGAKMAAQYCVRGRQGSTCRPGLCERELCSWRAQHTLCRGPQQVRHAQLTPLALNGVHWHISLSPRGNVVNGS